MRSRLTALVAGNKETPKRYEIQTKSDGTEATIYLYDLIDAYWGVSAQAFVRDLNGLTASTIHLRINSPGGDVFEGRAIATAIAQHSATVVAHVDGLAASAASFIAIAADRVEMAQGSFLMIHKASAFAYGNADELKDLVALLEKVDGSLVAEYVKKTGKTAEAIAEWMADETWFTAEEAVAEGFADAVASQDDAVSNSWDLSVFANAPTAKVVEAVLKRRELENAQRIAAESQTTEQADIEHAERRRRFDYVDRVA